MLCRQSSFIRFWIRGNSLTVFLSGMCCLRCKNELLQHYNMYSCHHVWHHHGYSHFCQIFIVLELPIAAITMAYGYLCFRTFFLGFYGCISCGSSRQSEIRMLSQKKTKIFHTGISHDKFNSCLGAAVGTVASCSECFAKTADYGFDSCKSACLLGWCKSGCLTCTAPSQKDLPACTGIPVQTASPCLESTGVSCSAAEQADPEDGCPDVR